MHVLVLNKGNAQKNHSGLSVFAAIGIGPVRIFRTVWANIVSNGKPVVFGC